MSRIDKLRDDALAIFQAAIEAANAKTAVLRHLKTPGAQRILLLAVGKAAPQMAEAVEQIAAHQFIGGLVITKHGHAADYQGRCDVIEAGHPVPDHDSVRAGLAAMDLLRQLTEDDLLIAAVSGGASALLCAPLDGITLQAIQETTNLLLRAGADISELNCVRKHLSKVKGGNLAAQAHPAAVLSLLLSDVVGDPLDVIGSGLTAPDSSTFADALCILKARGAAAPQEVWEHLEAGARGETPETPKPGDPLFQRVENRVVGSSSLALEAAAHEAERLGYRSLILSSRIQGESRDAARLHADILWKTAKSGYPLRPPACILSGGETTVTVSGQGKGGRNQEFALAAAIALNGANNVMILAGGTDGTDGPTDAAGALASGDTVGRAAAIGLDASDYLLRNDSYAFFDALGDLVKTGPTGTNVMDVNIMLAS